MISNNLHFKLSLNNKIKTGGNGFYGIGYYMGPALSKNTTSSFLGAEFKSDAFLDFDAGLFFQYGYGSENFKGVIRTGIGFINIIPNSEFAKGFHQELLSLNFMYRII